MIITAVRRVRGLRVVLTDETGAEWTLDKTIWEESPYGVGSSLSAQEMTALSEASARRRAEEKAVFLLAGRDYSRRELERRLCREKGHYCPENRTAAAEAAARMEELGYVNDAAYAARTAERLMTERLYGRRRAEQVLTERGIAPALAREAVSAVDCDETELALAFLHRKRYTVPRDARETARVAAALARYGYGGDTVRAALRQFTAAASEEYPEGSYRYDE